LLSSYRFKVVKNVGILSIDDGLVSARVNANPKEGYLMWFESILEK